MNWLFWTLIAIWAGLIIATFWHAHKPEPMEDDEIDRGGHVRIIESEGGNYGRP